MDLRGSDIGPDRLDALRLAGPESDAVEAEGFTVSDTVQNASLLTPKVAEFADLPDTHLWLLKRPPTFLVTVLRDGIARLGEGAADGCPDQGTGRRQVRRRYRCRCTRRLDGPGRTPYVTMSVPSVARLVRQTARRAPGGWQLRDLAVRVRVPGDSGVVAA
ncbi:hypothetical protein ABZT26_28120 [Streptomyces sp. NPDC005395]|uniref:hypothetical protein n=1 Tax=unclassified Streptomyces TaxID=2593676 RepID=UPI0033A0D7D4